MKIINILTHPPQEILWNYSAPEEYVRRFPLTEYIKIDKYPYWIGFFRLDWHHRWGSYVKKLAPEIEMECWRPYCDKINQVYQKDVDGLIHKVFPSKEIKIKKYGSISRSPLMLKELQKEIYKGKVILHFYGSHNPLITWLINKLEINKTPIILQNLGGWWSWFDWKYKKNPIKLIHYINEKRMLKKVSLYLQASKVEEKFNNENFTNLKSIFFLNGIDLNDYPLIDKNIARQRLGIPSDQKIILYVGRYYRTKGVDLLIEAYKKLQKERADVELYLVGGYIDDEFYTLGKEAGAKMILRTDNPINDYYAAADVFVMPVNDSQIRDFGGFGIAPIEALALNTPVISPNIIHLPSESDVSKLGVVSNSNNLLECIKQVLIKGNYKTREVVEKHFDIVKNTQNLIKIYENLSRKYYEEDYPQL